MSDAPEEVLPAVPEKGASKILPILVVVNTLMIAGVLIFVMKRPSAQAASSGKEHGATTEEHGDKAEHGEKPVTREMELGKESDKKPFEIRMARVRDLVIGYLSDRTEDELRGSEGLAQVKE